MGKRADHYTIEVVNQRLKRDKTSVTLKLERDRVYMVATLPPKPWLANNRTKPYQQKISTGQQPSTTGLQKAERQARELSNQIVIWRSARKDPRAFDWSIYRSDQSEGDKKNAVGSVVEAFQTHYLETNSLNPSTWRNHWRKVYRRLPQDAPLHAELLIQEALKTPRDSRMRLETCRKLQKLADFAGVEVDLLQYKGSYGPSKVKARRLPSDEEIAQWYYKIPNPDWQWVYGMIAAGALRPHESFFCEWQTSGLEVLKGKTGPRFVSQFFYPEWIEEWELQDMRLPSVDAEQAYEDVTLGAKVSRQLKRYGVPFSAYDLRHAAAVRMSVVFNLPVTVSARLMGHSPTEHMRTYHKHINQAQQERAIARVMNASDRPQPPSASPSQEEEQSP